MPDRLTAEGFAAWKRLPQTEAVFEYLSDLRNLLMEQWARGGPLEPGPQERARAYGEFIELAYADIEQFYGSEEEDGESRDG